MDFLLVNKQLLRTSKVAYVYKHEDNVNQIHLIIPETNNGHDLSTLKPYIEISVPNGVGSDINCFHVEYDEEPYKENYLSLTVPIEGWITKHEGTVGIRVLFHSIISEDKEELILKSTLSTFEIVDSDDVSVIGYKPGGGESSSDETVYTVVQEDITDIQKAQETIGKTSFNDGDVLVIKDDYGVSAGYQYDNEMWIAFTGNVSADNVIISEDVLLAGGYSQVGNITKDIKETRTLSAKGKTLTEFIQTVFTKEEQPTKTDPSMSVTLSQAGTYEVGTTITPSFFLSFNEGSYTYDTTTGVVFSNWNTKDAFGNESNAKSGTFDSFLVLDNTNYSVTSKVHHSDGTIAKTNLGNNSNPPIQISAKDLSKTSSKVTGYRPFFYGLTTDLNPIDSDVIRGLTNGGNYNGSKTISYGINGASAKRVIMAIPKSSTRSGLVSVFKTDGLRTDITEVWEKQSATVLVDDKRKTGTNLVDYVLWIYQPAKIDENEQYEIKIG